MTISALKMHFRRLPPKLITNRDFKKFANERFMNSLQSVLFDPHDYNIRDPDIFFQICQKLLDNHAPQKNICGNYKPFMSESIMQQTRLRKKFPKNPTDENRYIFTKQRNSCVSLLRKEEKQYLMNLDEKDITDNRKFWHTVKLFFSEYIKSR